MTAPADEDGRGTAGSAVVNAGLDLCTWDRLLGFLRAKYPRLDKYGIDKGGDARAFVALFRNEDQLKRIAAALWEIDCSHQAKLIGPYDAIKKAGKDRSDAEKHLLETIL